MSPEKTAALRTALERGTGADVVVEPDASRTRTGLRAFFADLGAKNGPVFTLHPSGLRRHRVEAGFGPFSRTCIDQMAAATTERLVTAQALMREVARSGECRVAPGQTPEDWRVTGQDFAVEVLVRDVEDPTGETAIVRTAETVMAPLMAVMAELIGYDDATGGHPVGEMDIAFDVEGQLTEAVVKRRERSARNRLLCLSIHGRRCAACGFEPEAFYGDAGAILEVHHLEPVSLLSEPRAYDPATDLAPLCPNCHRAVHTRRPIPWTLEELREKLAHGGG